MENPNEGIARAPLPTQKTLKQRKSLVLQLFRFIVMNFKMIKMIRKAHHPMRREVKNESKQHPNTYFAG